jgi:hypothetical protein
MKKFGIFTLCAFCAILLASCGKSKDFKYFVGTWGVETIEYYNIDYAGNPIASTIVTHNFDPEDLDDGIQLVFRENKTGEMRDSNLDTLWIDWNEETQAYESYIYNPDTTLVYTFTYSYDKSEAALYMTMKYTYPYVFTRTFKMEVSDMTDNSFTYENEYDLNYVERAYMKRLSDTPSKSSGSRNKPVRLHKPGSMLGYR